MVLRKISDKRGEIINTSNNIRINVTVTEIPMQEMSEIKRKRVVGRNSSDVLYFREPRHRHMIKWQRLCPLVLDSGWVAWCQGQ